jgi:hypothetical protein
MHFTVVMNIFDLITGALGVLCGLGGSTTETAAA